MTKNGYQRFDVHWFSQQASREDSEPTQPDDASKDWRMYVIIASPRHSQKITCCPIQNNSKGQVAMTEVELRNGSYQFIDKDSKIVCHEIYTLQKQFFRKHVGHLDASERQKVELALKTYLSLK